MNFKSKKISLFILSTTSVVFARILFFFFADPEGPNLLVVIGMAVVIYFLSFGVYEFIASKYRFLYLPLLMGRERLLVTICMQILIVIAFYSLLN